MDSSRSSKSGARRFSWYGLVFTVVSGINLLFILFDFTYLRFRDVYFDYLPAVQRLYDPLKGIEPHRFTTEYLAEFDRLAAALQAGGTGKEADEAQKQLRESMTTLSSRMIDDSP
ncbi:MAG: hypothetical protein HY248_02900, partial [Fimbriimonas ginsengisoli]|nr:hypothetical protein [Fimbriimonas ginsengisoli]